ncbi:hypothetical protein [Microtetraspora malaysiensis]|uniref:Uncharacterized protein n=1 Tax=Microtetraspora malaysiensis TaxID=161358 RepID=A0ABW6SKD5_9ACTN
MAAKTYTVQEQDFGVTYERRDGGTATYSRCPRGYYHVHTRYPNGTRHGIQNGESFGEDQARAWAAVQRFMKADTAKADA